MGICGPHISQDPVMPVHDMCTLEQGKFDGRTCVQIDQVHAHVCTFIWTWAYVAHIWTYESHVLNSIQWDLYMMQACLTYCGAFSKTQGIARPCDHSDRLWCSQQSPIL